MTEPIKAALSPGEWAVMSAAAPGPDSLFIVDGKLGFDIVAECPDCGEGFPTFTPITRPSAVAALALQKAGPDGEPLFTWEMVDALRFAIRSLERRYATASDFALSPEHEAAKRAEYAQAFEAMDALRSTRNRVASLLPPREP